MSQKTAHERESATLCTGPLLALKRKFIDARPPLVAGQSEVREYRPRYRFDDHAVREIISNTTNNNSQKTNKPMKTNSKDTCLLSLVIGLLMWAGSAKALPGGTIYVCNSGDDTVSVISLNTLTVVTSIAVGDGPGFVIVTPDGSKAYVANRLANTISVIRTSTDSVIATIPVGTEPTQIAVSRDSQRVYVANRGSSTISIIDTASDSILTNVPTFRSSPITLAFHPVRDEVWVGYNSGLEGGGAIEARSATDLSLLASLVSDFIYYASADLAFLPDGSEVYGAEGCGDCGRYNRISGSYSSGAIDAIEATFFEDGNGAALAVAVNPISSRVYLAGLGQSGPHRVVEFDRNATPQIGRTVTFSAAPSDLVVAPDGQRIFVANQAASGFVSVLDTVTFTSVGTVNVGNSPSGIAIKPNPPINLTIAVADVQVCWNSLSNTIYQVEYKSGLTTNTWQPLGPLVNGNGSTNCIVDSVLIDPQRVYRVRIP